MVFEWDRLWVPQAGTIHVGGFFDKAEGYLADPDDGFFGKQANGHLLKTGALLKRVPGCLVLTGDPGMGKTQTLRRHLERQPEGSCLYVEFRDVPDASMFMFRTLQSTVWQTWKQGDKMLTLVVDGVDEGLIKIAGFVSFLAGALKTEPLERLQVILTCRSLEWPQSEGESLQSLWRQVKNVHSGVFELCPLLERDVRLAAVQTRGGGRPADDFMRTVRRRQLIGLASRPLTLKMLLREFRKGGGLSKSHRELYLKYARAMCTEIDPVRRGRLRNVAVFRLHYDQRKRERVAQRIAALLLLGGRSAVWTRANGEPSPSDLTMSEICGGSEVLDGVDFVVDEDLVQSVLETPLFWARGPDRATFYHQTFAECLAAEYLRGLSTSQLRSLFCRRDGHGEFVNPALAELAAWVASASPAFLHHLLEHDPETLLRSDVSAIKESLRAKLVEAVLAKAAAEQLFDARGIERFFHTLNHPMLGPQLRSVLHDRKANLVVRRLALGVAEHCGLRELFPDILSRLADSRDQVIHAHAAASLTGIMDARLGPELLRFFLQKRKAPLAAGPQLSILHALLQHGTLTVSDALPHLGTVITKRDSSALILAQHVVAADAEALLDATEDWGNCFDALNPWYALARAGVAQAVLRIQEPGIRCRLARIWWRSCSSHQDLPFPEGAEEGQRTLAEILQDRQVRRLLVSDVVEIVAQEAPCNGSLFQLGVFAHPDDFEYHLDRLEQAPQAQKPAFATLVVASWKYEAHTNQFGRLLEVNERSPELREKIPWLRLWVLEEPSTIEARKSYYEIEIWRARTPKRRAKAEEPKAVWDRTFQALDANSRDSVPTLIKCLFYSPEREDAGEESDVRASPGWKYHTEEAREKILAAMRTFLVQAPGVPKHNPNGNSDWESQVYRALFALRAEIENTPTLAGAVKRHWLPVIFDEFSDASEHHREMVAIGYRLDGRAMRGLLKDKVLRAAKNDAGHCYTLREFDKCWEPALADFVVDFVSVEVNNPQTMGCIARHLAERDPGSALALIRRLRPLRKNKELAYRAALAGLISLRLLEGWDDIWPVLKRSKSLARAVLIQLELHEQRNFLDTFEPGCEQKIAEFYLYLRELFPPDEDPKVESGVFSGVTARMEIGRTRDRLPSHLVALSTPAAIAQLGVIAAALPSKDRIWMRWRLHEAIVARRRQTWTGFAPEVVLQMVQKTTRRFLTDDDDLLAVVTESLERFDRKLTRSPNSPKIEFWRERCERGRTKYFSPIDEVEMTRKIASWLETDLDPARGITVQREVQVQWRERTDIEVRAVGIQGTNLQPLQIVIEVKGCWNAGIRSALKSQLVDTYLQNAGWSHGIYLIAWSYCDRWNDPKKPRSSRLRARALEGARDEAAAMAHAYDGKREPFVVRSFVLDVRL